MEGNYAAIEVKPEAASRRGVRKNFETLTGFLEHAQYERGIYLFYGYRGDGDGDGDGDGPGIAAAELHTCSVRSRIQIWHHAAPNEPATRYPASA